MTNDETDSTMAPPWWRISSSSDRRHGDMDDDADDDDTDDDDTDDDHDDDDDDDDDHDLDTSLTQVSAGLESETLMPQAETVEFEGRSWQVGSACLRAGLRLRGEG